MIYPVRNGFAAYAEGFTPGEELNIESRSESEIWKSVTHADQDGKFSETIFPVVIGKTHGTGRYSASSETCSVAVDREWGFKRK